MNDPAQGDSQRPPHGLERTGTSLSVLRFMFKHYPFLLGPYRIVNDRRLRWMFKNEREHLATLPCGYKIWVDLQDNDGRAIFCGGNDPKLRRIIQAVLRHGDVVIDVGANHGEYTLLAAALVGNGGAVHAFEPNRVMASRLRRSIDANGLVNVKLFTHAVADASGFGRLKYFRGWSGGTRVVVSTETDSAREVELKTLDEVADLRKDGVARLLKIDVEGMEDAVLRGASRLLAEAPPDVILFESNPSERPFFDRKAPGVLEETGSYVVFEVCRSLVRLRLRQLHPKGCRLPRGRDFVAIRPACMQELAAVLPLREDAR